MSRTIPFRCLAVSFALAAMTPCNPAARADAPKPRDLSPHENSANKTAGKEYLKLNASGNIEANPLDLLYASSDKDLRADFEGKEVEVTGQWVADALPNGGVLPYKVAASFRNPAGANAPIRIGPFVETVRAVKIPQFAQVKVIGTMTFPVGENGERHAVIRAKSIHLVIDP